MGISYTYIYKGLKEAHIPARMELVKQSPVIILDGAHNPDGASVLSCELKKYSGNVTAIIGMMKDKDCDEFLKITLKHCKSAVAVKVVSNPRSMSAEELKEKASDYCNCYSATDYYAALNKAYALSNNGPIFIFGSLYLAADMRKMFF